MPGVADGQRRVGHVAQIGDLAVDFGRHRHGFVAKSKVQRQAIGESDIILHEPGKQPLAVLADGIDLAGDGKVHVGRTTGQKQLEVVERDDAAFLTRRVLIELQVLHLPADA